jgi:hypothetical protein
MRRSTAEIVTGTDAEPLIAAVTLQHAMPRIMGLMGSADERNFRQHTCRARM